MSTRKVVINTAPQILRITLNSDGDVCRVHLRENALIVKVDGTRLGSFNSLNFIAGDGMNITGEASGVQGNLTFESAASITLTNGLTLTGTVGKLGGTLSENTAIEGDALYGLTLGHLTDPAKQLTHLYGITKQAGEIYFAVKNPSSGGETSLYLKGAGGSRAILQSENGIVLLTTGGGIGSTAATTQQIIAGTTLTLQAATSITSTGSKHSFTPAAGYAGINVGSLAGNPSSLANGDLWYNSSSNELNARINGATVALGAGAGSLATLTDVTLTSLSTNDFLKYSGTVWVNRTPAQVLSDIGAVSSTLAGLSILGRAANTSGTMAAITGADGQLLRVTGTTLSFGNDDLNSLTLKASASIDTASGSFSLGAVNATTLNLGTGTANTNINIGTSGTNTIQIGNSNSTVNILGTVLYENVTNLQVTDKLITLNKGGAAASATGTGFEIEENSAISAYFKTTGGRDGWLLKAPSITNDVSFLFTNISGARSYTLPNASGTLALTSDLTAYQPLDADLTSWAAITRASGFDTWVTTPSSDNLRSLLTDELGTGAALFEGGARGLNGTYTMTGAVTDAFGAQTWSITSSATSGTFATLSSSTLTSGTGFKVDITGTAALTGNIAGYFKQSGANASGSQTTYSGYFENIRTGSGTNIGVFATATGGTNNYAAIFTGTVGINTTAPTANGLQIGTVSAVSTATPSTLDMGGSFADAVTSSKAKWKLYNDGTAINTYGIGISSGAFNFFKSSSGAYNWLFADVQEMSLTPTGLAIGTSLSPSAKLHVVSNVFTTASLIVGASSSLTTGFLANFQSTSTVINHTAGTHALVGVDASGANSTSGKTVVGLMSKVANTGTTSTNIGIYSDASGATSNYSGLFVGGTFHVGSAISGAVGVAKLAVRGFSSNDATTTVFYTTDLAGTRSLSITPDGSIFIGSTNNTLIGPSNGTGTYTNVGNSLLYKSSFANSTSSFAHVLQSTGTTYGSNDAGLLHIGGYSANGITASSGAVNFTGIRVRYIINQTGTASGNVFGYEYDPTVTAVLGTHYAWRNTSGQALFNGTTVTASTAVDIRGVSSGSILRLANSSNTERWDFLDDGSLQLSGSAGTSGQVLTSAGAGTPTWVDHLIPSAINSISPTAPNRTVTITYQGTTLYLSAKTTND